MSWIGKSSAIERQVAAARTSPARVFQLVFFLLAKSSS